MRQFKARVKVPLKGDGSITDIINDFINTLEEVTGGGVDVKLEYDGTVTIFYESSPEKIINKNKQKLAPPTVEYRLGDITDLLSGNEISDPMVEPKADCV